MAEPLEVSSGPWQRVARRYVVVVMAEALVAGVVLAGVAVWLGLVPRLWWAWIALAVIVVVTAVQFVVAPRRARAIGYRLREDDLLLRRGILFQRFVAVPYGRMQLVDINRGPLARMLHLSELSFVTAAATTGVAIPGLPEEEARGLRDRLVELAESRRTGL